VSARFDGPGDLVRDLEPSARAFVEFENSGSTPAYDVRILGGMCIRVYAPEMVPTSLNLTPIFYPPFAIGRRIFGPSARHDKSETLTDENNPPRGRRAPRPVEAAGVWNGNMTIFLYGEVQYRDEFRAKRWNTYCFIWNRDVEMGRGDGMAAFQLWNQAGVEGEDQKPPFCVNSVWLE
jgi:hypothetical protein